MCSTIGIGTGVRRVIAGTIGTLPTRHSLKRSPVATTNSSAAATAITIALGLEGHGFTAFPASFDKVIALFINVKQCQPRRP